MASNKAKQSCLAVSPSVIDFDVEDAKAAGSATAFVEVKNLDTQPRSIKIKKPSTQWFSITSSGIADQTVRVAPGLSASFEVTFDARQLACDRDYHGSIQIASELESVELWLHASMHKPQVLLEGTLDFGLVAVSSKASRQLQLQNAGRVPAQYRFDWDKSLPLSIEPAAGLLAPDGDKSSSSSTAMTIVKLQPIEAGAVVGEVVLAVAGKAEPYRISITATAVQQTFQLVDSGNTALSELDFGRMFFGEACTKMVRIFNNGPAEASFDVSYGSAADMKAIIGADGDAAGDAEAGDDELSSFLQAARIRAKAREERASVLKVTPVTGVVPPFSSMQLQVTFRPLAAPEHKGFSAQPLTPQQQAQVFDYLVQVNLAAGSKHLRLPIKGCGLAPHLVATPQVLHFGIVPCYEWADQLLQIANSCAELPMHVMFDRSGPYFSTEPSQVELPPGATASVLIRYLPQALGNHMCSLSFQVVSSRVNGKVLAEAQVQVQGSSFSLGKQQPLPGGITATPGTFKKPRAFVNEDEAAVAHLTARKTFTRPKLWEAGDAAYSQAGLGPLDQATRELQMRSTAHADRYTTFIRAGRTAAARAYLTQPEGDDNDVNMGMKPYRGLNTGRIELPKQAEPLWTFKQHSAGPLVQRLPSASVLAGILMHKEWPETAQERTECSLTLTAAQLSKLVVAPRQLDFGKVSAALVATTHWVVTNTLSTAVHVVLDLHSLQELTCTTPASQVIAPGSMAKFQLALRCHDVQQLKERVQYCINGCHLQPLDVIADVVAVTLELSCEELLFSFSLDNWDDFVEQTLLMENVHNFPVEYDWALSQSTAFSVSPASGTVKPRSSCACTVRWTPASAATADGKTAKRAKEGNTETQTASDRQLVAKQSSKKSAGSAAAVKEIDPALNSSGTSSTSSALATAAAASSDSAVMVELPPDASAANPVVGGAVGCQHIGFMTLKLKGGADVAPKKVLLHGDLPAGLLKFREKEINLGPVPLHQQQVLMVQLKNLGIAEAAFRVCSNSLLTVTPDRGHVAAESVSELELQWLPEQQGPISAALELEVRGSKPLKLPIRAEGILPNVYVQEGALAFPSTFIGSTAPLALTLVNTTPVPATLLCDLLQQPEFELALTREGWTAAGYTACPVQQIGANGEASAVGSKRPSRRITSQGGRNHAASWGDSGYQFLIQLKPNSTLPLQMVYRPGKAQDCQFNLPLVLHSSGTPAAAAAATVACPASATASATSSQPNSARLTAASEPTTAPASSSPAAHTLAVPVSASAVVARVIVSRNSIDFGSKVVQRSRKPGRSPYSQSVFIRNNTTEALQLAVAAPTCSGITVANASADKSAFSLEGLDTGRYMCLSPDEGLEFVVRFSPAEAKAYDAVIDVHVDGDDVKPYLQLHLAGTGTLPCLTFSAAECLLPPVPLDITSSCRFFIINQGYDNLELTVRLPTDSSHIPIKLAFPEGNLIGLAKERLPVDVTFRSSRPLAFTAMVDFLDEDGRAFSIAVTASADNCSLTHQPFMQMNAARLQLAASESGGPLRLLDSPSYEMPGEAIGPTHLTQGVCKYLTALTSRNLSDSGRSSSSTSGAVEDDSRSSSNQHDSAVLRQAMLSSKGKQLLDLVELLGGKQVSRKGVSSKPSSNKVETALQLLGLYDAILGHLLQHGALVNAVKSEYLLEEADFRRVMEARTAAAAGNAEQEYALELWAPVEQEFGVFSAQAWNCVLLQVFKVFVLARVTPAAVRQLLCSTHANTDAAEGKQQMAAPDAKAASLALAAGSVTAPGQSPGASRSKPSVPGPAGVPAVAAPAASALPTGGAAGADDRGGSSDDANSGAGFPTDEVLSSSNIYNTAEACLLAWLSAHMDKSFPQAARDITNFTDDIRNGLALGAMLAAHWPGGTAGTLLSKLHVTAADARHLRENQELVVKAMQELCLPFEIVPADIQEAEAGHILLLVAYLFTALPQLLPRATLDFGCKLGEQQVRDIALTNPTRRPLSYSVRLEGQSDFLLEGQLIKIDPGHSTQVPVRFKPSTSLPKSCRLVLMSRRDGSSASAATLVFNLRGCIDSRSPLKQVAAQAALYQLSVMEFTITNPFQQDCDFAISILQQPPAVVPAGPAPGQGKGKGGKAAAAAAAAAGSSSSGSMSSSMTLSKKAKVDQVVMASSMFPDAFGLERHRLRLRAGASEKLRLSFLPLFLPPAQLQPSTEPTAAGQPLPLPKSIIRSLLVLCDSDCGEFAYELAGEVLPPASFMQHAARVGLEGTQVVELQLPFTNHLLEAARRVYAEKHPLAKDREQMARLRADIGRSSDRGERLLVYSVTCSNSLINCPATLQLKAGMISPSPAPASAAAATRSATASSEIGASVSRTPGTVQHEVGNSGSGSSGGGRQQQPQDPGKDNLLRLSVKPVGCGVYPAKITLTSPCDVRVLDVEVTASSMGQTCTMELETPARQQVMQELPLVNATDSPMTVAASLSAKCFSGPREVTVPAKSSGVFPLTFCPSGTGSFTGSLELFIAATGERNMFNLLGKGSEPLAEGHVSIECQARSPATRRLQVPNITGTLPLQYNVYADLECLSGPATHTCSSANRGDTYKLSVMPLRSGSFFGSISFVSPDGNYCWYSLEVHASEPPGMGVIPVSCPVHQAVAIQVSLTNPTDRPLALTARYDGSRALVGPASFVAPPSSSCSFECFYTPLLVGKEEGELHLISEEAGEFWWRVEMEATPGGPEHLPLLRAALGRSADHKLIVSNPTAAEATFTASSSEPSRFAVKPGSFVVAGNASAEVVLEYRPGSLGSEERGTVHLTSATAGSIDYVCSGRGELPEAEAASISAALGSSGICDQLCWSNPFDSPATVRLALQSSDPVGTFSLMLPGTRQVSPQQQEQQPTKESSSCFTGKDGADDAEAYDSFLERAEADGDSNVTAEDVLAAAIGGTSGASSSHAAGQLAAAAAAAVQQLAEVTVAPNGTLRLPVAFSPTMLCEATAELSLSLVSPAVPAPVPLKWHYKLHGFAHADPRGVKFAVRCKAKQVIEEVLHVPLPGLDPSTKAAIAAAASSAVKSATAVGDDWGNPSPAAAHLQFNHELLLPSEHRAGLAAAVAVQQLDKLPVNDSSPPIHDSSTAATAAAEMPPPLMRFKLRFTPQKAVTAQLQLAVTCSTGARWVYDVQLMAGAPEIDGVLTLEAHMGCTAEMPLLLYSSGPDPQAFTAQFTPDSPLNFDVLPAAGLLLPHPPDAEAVANVDGQPGAGAAVAGSAPMKITFFCKELGKVIQGKLVVVTPDSQHSFIVKGRQPAYVPPKNSPGSKGLPAYLTSGTASSMAKSSRSNFHSCSSAAVTGSVSSSVTRLAAGAAATASGPAASGGQSPARVRASQSYIQHNIKAAKTGSTSGSPSPMARGGANGGGSNGAGSDSSSSSSSSKMRPWA